MALDPIWWRASSYTAGAFLLLALGLWWLYRSPVRRAPSEAPPRASARLRAVAVFVALVTGVGLYVAAMWDAAMHVRTGVIPAGADFLWPPHLLFYAGFAGMLAFALSAMAYAGARSGLDPRPWVRRNPLFGGLAFAALYTIVALPGDALWHELYGIDLTAWSPPHVLLVAAATAQPVIALALARRPVGGAVVGTPWLYLLFGVLFNELSFLTFEWELPTVAHQRIFGNEEFLPSSAFDRPGWSYPLLSGLLGFTVLVLARAYFRTPYAATATAATALGVRVVTSLVLEQAGELPPVLPLPLLLGAVLLDFFDWDRIKTPWAKAAWASLAFHVGFYALAVPLLEQRAWPALDGPAYLATAAVGMAAGAALHPWLVATGQALRTAPNARKGSAPS